MQLIAESTFSFIVDTDAVGLRLDRFLVQQLPSLSRTRLQDLIEQGHVKLRDKAITDVSHRIKEGDNYTLTVPPPEEEQSILAQPLPLEILFEDEDFLIINKAAGMVVHPAPGHRESTLVNALLAHCGDSLSGIGGVKRPGIVHRLDKDTSGLIIVAKNDKAHHSLSEQLSTRTLSRRYWALVWGTLPQQAGLIEGAIGRSPKNRQKMAVVTRGGKEAQTRYTVKKIYTAPISHLHTISLIECALLTGRTHQIRVHFSTAGHPLLGDPQYGRKGTPKIWPTGVHQFPRQALHAFQLTLQHPRTQEVMVFEAPLPSDMQNLIELLQHYCYDE